MFVILIEDGVLTCDFLRVVDIAKLDTLWSVAKILKSCIIVWFIFNQRDHFLI